MTPLLLLLTSAALPCRAPILEGPVPLAFEEGRAGAPRRACPTTELALSGDVHLIADVEHFYGNVLAAGLLTFSYAPTPDLEAFVEVEVVRHQTVISSLSANSLGVGHTSVGATYVFLPGDLTLAATARLTLPTTSDYYEAARPFILDAGLLLTTWVLSSLELHGQLGLLGSVAAGEATPAHGGARGGVFLLGGTSWCPARWFALIFDLEVQALYHAAFDHLAVAGGTRFLIGDVGVDLFALAPLAGRERTTVAGMLRLRYDFGASASLPSSRRR